ncbi:MAG: Ribonuclease 3 [Alphaproteobacteria bacterium MarineAlpha11_Bin1]|nr:MAG: Ribonuclease 3 [Alphaproteobacteria bacterium MarineAlpha11_Bin1]|tara:strand:+ start:5560 stop:6246 length:687 start_codon:yes stop_codon:yes gene_type:complete
MTPSGSNPDDLEKTLGYRFRDNELLLRALTHSSLKKTNKDPSYERLEFLGDRVLGLIIAELLIEKFPESAEGELAPRLAVLVSGRTIAGVARSLDLGSFIRMTNGEVAAGTNGRSSVLADCCEAVIGAVFRDGGLKPSTALVRRFWEPLLENVELRAAKTELQEWAQGLGLPLPRYTVVGRQGPAHAPEFTIKLEISALDPVLGKGSSKQAAEQAAASEMLALVQEKS